MPIELPKLPFGPGDLEPYISERTLEFHYGKHHQAYVDNINKLVVGTPFENASLEAIIKDAQGPVFNNGAQVWNHSFYFSGFNPKGGGQPGGRLLQEIGKAFGSFAGFKEQFSKAAATLFGSGWAWLVKDQKGALSIVQESNAGNPIRGGFIPVLTCDVWEHAYYLDYQNRRPAYVEAYWNIVDWEVASQRYME
jgi:Fe-Mn family superoxide dismutase